ncbi:MAG: hypothetical protein IIB73_05195 [Proteobacteria bacterium]|nr:hypothetical protein [Pseudomonadota bacterium]
MTSAIDEGPGDNTSAEISWLTLRLSGGFFLLFVCMALIDLDGLSYSVNVVSTWSKRFFGAYWQVLLLLTFLRSRIAECASTTVLSLAAVPAPKSAYL